MRGFQSLRLLNPGSTPIGGFFLGSLGQVAGAATAILTCATFCLFGVGTAASYRWRMTRAAPQT